MYVSTSRLPHLLKPQDYYTPESHQRDLNVLRRTWHLVGTTSDLASDGDFITRQIAGVPVQVRNFDGALRALSNVCAHRHSLLSSAPCGRSSSMRCQYHGWEYHEDGRTGKIPQPKNFIPFDRETLRLPVYALETVGQLVFVNIDTNAKPIKETWDEDFYDSVANRFSNRWRKAFGIQLSYEANWKVPIENSLESYHVPAVHPKTFREDPGNERSEHGILFDRTWFRTMLPFCPHSWVDNIFQRLEGWFVQLLGHQRQDSYEQHHVFPNLLFSFTDAISLCQSISPTGCNTSQATICQFGRFPATAGWRTLPAIAWNRLKSVITRHILQEDLRIFSAIQQGLQASPHQGVLGICEERIHRFQEYLIRETAA